MKNTVKRIIAVIMTFAMFSVSGLGYVEALAEDDDSCILSFEGNYNEDVMDSIPADEAMLGTLYDTTSDESDETDSNEAPISLIIYQNNDAYTVEGEIRLENGSYEFKADGEASIYQLESGVDAYICTAYCELEDAQCSLNFNIHTIPAEDKTYVQVTANLLDENGDIADHRVYAFGELFDEMNEFVPIYADEHDITDESEEDVDDSSDDTLVGTEGAVSEVQAASGTKFIKTKYKSYGNSTGGTYNLIALSVFAPKSIEANKTYYVSGKINANRSNAKAYAKKYVTVGVITGMNVGAGTVKITAQRDQVELSNQKPTSQKLSVTIPIYYLDSSSVLKSTDFSLTIPKVVASLSSVGKYNKAGLDNCASWTFYGTHNNICWSSSTAPKNMKKAYAGRAYIINFEAPSSTTTCNVVYSGSVTYNYTSQYGAIQTTGSFKATVSYTQEVTLKS